MKLRTRSLHPAALLLAAAPHLHGQYAPPAPTQPFPGFLNAYLRQQDPYLSQWDIGGSFRMRYELKDGAIGVPPANDFRDLTTSTTENSIDYLSTKLLARIAYTSRLWGFWVEGRSSETFDDPRSTTGAGPVPGPGGRGGPEQDGWVDLHQAFVTLGNHKEFPVSLKVGRQELSYGDERLVGAFGWHNIGRVFDAAKLRWQNEWGAAEAFTGKLVLPDDNSLNTWNDYNLFSGLHATTAKIPRHTTELYFFARNDDLGSTTANPGAVLPFQVPAPAARDVYTVGGRLKSAPAAFGCFDYTVEGAYQFGDWKTTAASPTLDQDAFAFMVNGGYTFSAAPMTPRLALEYAYGSGDGDPNDGEQNTFDNLYPTNHKFYGYMDFFSWQNIHDVRGIFTLKPTPKLSLALEGHFFWLADTHDGLYNAGGIPRGLTPNANGFGRNPGYDSFVGSEIDTVAGYALTRFATLEAGYGHFFAGTYLDQTWQNAGGARDADWFYVQALVRF